MAHKIVALQVETHCYPHYHVCDQLVLYQNTVLQVDANCWVDSSSTLCNEFYFAACVTCTTEATTCLTASLNSMLVNSICELQQCGKWTKHLADGEDEPEFKLLESHKFALYKNLEGFHSLWDTLFAPSKNKQRKANGLEELSQKCNFLPLAVWNNSFILKELFMAQEIKKKMTARSQSGSSSNY